MIVIISFLFNDEKALESFKKAVSHRLCVSAEMLEVEHFEDNVLFSTLIIFFSPKVTLVGPMTSDKVLDAVKHYLGLCRHSNVEMQDEYWREATDILVELIPLGSRDNWVYWHEELSGLCTQKSVLRIRGRGFSCGTLCRGSLDLSLLRFNIPDGV